MMRRATQKSRPSSQFLHLALCLAGCLGLPVFPDVLAAEHPSREQVAYQAYQLARGKYTNELENVEAAWRLGRACFDWAEFATNDTQRAAVAHEGINACERALKQDPASPGAHYYLGMNQGQLARTMSLGALKLVSKMEVHFQTARSLDAKFDYAGPDRNLGLLYLQAPGWPVSVGNKSKARSYLHKAVELAPFYPENRLNLMEAYDKWNDPFSLRREMKNWNKNIKQAHDEFPSADWYWDWLKWDQRLQSLRERIEDGPPDLRPPKARD